MNFTLLFFIIFSIFNCTFCDLLVKVEQGVLKGKEVVKQNKTIYHQFSGIPYAKPPLYDLRFQVNYYLWKESTKEISDLVIFHLIFCQYSVSFLY